MKIGTGFSKNNNVAAAIKESVKLAFLGLKSETISLAIIFTTIDFAYQNFIKTTQILIGEDVPVIGATGAAIISSEGIYRHGVVVMLIDFSDDKIYLNQASVKNINAQTPLEAGRELGKNLLFGFRDMRRVLSLIFSDGLISGASELIFGIEEILGTSFPIIGASASDNMQFKKTYTYSNLGALDDSATGIILGGKLNFGFGIKHGWKPLGKPRRVTKSNANIVYEIDASAASLIYEEYFNYDLRRLKKELKRISVLYPIGIYLEGEDEYILRNLREINEDGTLIFQGDVPQESQIRLMIGTKESCLEATRHAVEEAKQHIGSPQSRLINEKRNNFALVFDSVSRYILLRRDASKELEIVRAGLGKDVPLIGLYTFGEQAPLKATSYHGQTHFHNQTIAILTIGQEQA